MAVAWAFNCFALGATLEVGLLTGQWLGLAIVLVGTLCLVGSAARKRSQP